MKTPAVLSSLCRVLHFLLHFQPWLEGDDELGGIRYALHREPAFDCFGS
jgi:hypothetical protein